MSKESKENNVLENEEPAKIESEKELELSEEKETRSRAKEDLPASEQRGYRQPLWVSMFAIIGIFIGATLIGGVTKVLMRQTAAASEGFSNFMAYLITFSITIVFAVWIVIGRGTKRPVLKFSLKKADPTLILWGLILMLVTSVVIEPLIAVFPDTNVDLLRTITATGGWAMLTSVVLAPIMEEMLFRGVIQESVTREYGGVKGVLFASLLFALAHITVPQQAVNAFFMGLILGYIYIKTNSLIPVIIIHALNNAIAYIMMSLFDSEIVMLRDLIGNKVLFWVVYGICVVIFLIAVVNITLHLNKVEGEKFAKRQKS